MSSAEGLLARAKIVEPTGAATLCAPLWFSVSTIGGLPV